MKPVTGLDSVALQVARLGSSGVDVFFVLSGYLITGILLDSKSRPDYFRRFYIRRTLRIFPLYYLALVIAFWVWPRVVPADSLLIYRLHDHGAWYWTYTANWLFAWKGTYFGLAHFWSLAIEEQFYLVWPFVVLRLGLDRLIWVAGACTVVPLMMRLAMAASGVDVMVAYVMTPTRFDGLALGALLAGLSRRPEIWGRVRKLALPLGLASIGLLGPLLLGSRHGRRSHLLMTVGVSLVSLFAAALVVAASSRGPSGWTGRILTSRPLVSFGFYSYAIYVFHPFIHDWAHRRWDDAFLPTPFGSILPGRLVFVAGGIGLSYLVALASWHLYERHWLRLKERLS